MRIFVAAALAAFTFTSPAVAQDREVIGNGRLFNNDYLGDGHDRWRTGSYVISHVRGRDYFDGKPQGFGDIIEYRLRAELITAMRGPAPGDRPYVGALSFGAHTHFDVGVLEVSMGADVVAVGPQTGMSDFQKRFHEAFSMPAPKYVSGQIGDAVYLSATAAVARPVRVSEAVTLRPFAEVSAGGEDMVRIGADVIVGAVGHDALLLRDVVTGQLYRGTEGAGQGFSFVFGADYAAVSSSKYLPADRGFVATEDRYRARAGVHWQVAPEVSVFYGATYLSEEFVGQHEGQVIGSLKLNFNF